LQAAHPDAESQSLFERFTEVLKKAQWIVGDLLPGPQPRASVGAFRSLGSEAIEIAKH